MYEALKDRLLQLLKVPPEPDDPLGAGESLLVFRAAASYLKYKLIVWGLRQLLTLPALVAAVVGLGIAASALGDSVAGFLSLAVAVLLFLAMAFQVLLSYAMVRLDYEMRWYKVTDQSLRIREGVMHVREMTMTFANIQNISITQGPIQRWLGIADLKVQSAGGGGSAAGREQREGLGLNMHTGYFRGVDNAEHIRELMRRRLKAARDSGLGDPDDLAEDESAAESVPTALRQALEDLRAEAAAFRRAAERAATSPPT